METRIEIKRAGGVFEAIISCPAGVPQAVLLVGGCPLAYGAPVLKVRRTTWAGRTSYFIGPFEVSAAEAAVFEAALAAAAPGPVDAQAVCAAEARRRLGRYRAPGQRRLGAR